MVSKFRLMVIVRILLLTATINVWIYVMRATELYVTMALLAVIVVYQIGSMIVYVEKTNRDLRRFLEAVRHEDFTQTFAGAGLGSSFDELKSAFNEIITNFRKTRAEKEEHFRYLQTVVQHIGVGLIAFTSDGTVELMNTAARRLLRTGQWLPTVDLKNIHSIKTLSPSLADAFINLKTGDKAIIKVEMRSEFMQLMVQATEFRLREQLYRLVSLQNIQTELEEKEMEAWQNLIRVLTHEIMNSVTPISSLASTVNDLITKTYENENQSKPDPDTLSDIHGALTTIQNRSQGLIHFVDAYRNLTKIPKPTFRLVTVEELFARIEHLMRPRMAEKKILFSKSIDPQSLEITADSILIEQVLINLLVNAMHAVEGQSRPEIWLRADMDENGRVCIHVTDNGYGIIEEALNKIFIPFFTTKPDGSGIGLSLSRQIMRLHRGSITVQSKPHVKTVFTLRF